MDAHTSINDAPLRRSFLLHFDSDDYRAICFFWACVLYALFGSPTPDNFGFTEVLIAALLALSVGIGRGAQSLYGAEQHRFWKSAGQVFLIYGLVVPTIVAVISGYAPKAILRDIFPFLFIFMPLFLLPVLRAKPHYFRSVLCAVVLIGFVFALRSLVMRYDIHCAYMCRDELLYLENMPTVLFSCLICIGYGMRSLARGLTLRSVFVFTLLIAISLVPLAAMVVTLQRASIGAVIIYVLMVQAYYIYKSPVRGMNIFIFLVLAVLCLNISLRSVVLPLFEKTGAVGLNMRPQEFAAVWEVVTSHPLTFLFGIGWGGAFYSPAVGGLSVNFTHNFFSSFLLKTGLVGGIFCISYIVGLLERLMRVILKNFIFGLALCAPILIDLTLYASFKSLDFGLMLLMISGSLIYFRQSESYQRS